jgi:ankyrin repeat protein
MRQYSGSASKWLGFWWRMAPTSILATSMHERTPLHIASEEGHLENAEWLLDSCADVNNDQGGCGNTSVCSAAARGRLELVRMLLKRGAVIEVTRPV